MIYPRKYFKYHLYETEFYGVADIEIIEDRFLYIVCDYKFEEGEREAKGRARENRTVLTSHSLAMYL